MRRSTPTPLPSRTCGLLSLAVLATLVAPALGATGPDDLDPRIERVEAGLLPRYVERSRLGQPVSIADRMRELGIPGLSVAVIDDGEIAWVRGYGVLDVESERPVSPETLFLAGSISKPVAATGALRLVREGKLDLDEDVNERLRSWRVPASDALGNETVTLRRLLTHTAGLTVHGFPGYDRSAELPTVPQILDGEEPANTAAVRVDIRPGTEWRYSGGGYTVMQLLLSDVTGRPFEQLMAETVLAPFGMRASTYENPLPERLHALAASGYFAAERPVDQDWHVYPEMAAAGLWTTAGDLARFAIGIQKAAAGESDTVLDQATAKAMLTPGLGDWGLGPSLSGEGETARFGHGGRDAGFDARLLAYVSQGKGVALLINVNDNEGFLGEVVDAVARAHEWPDHDFQEQQGFVRLAPAELERYVGTYEIEAGGNGEGPDLPARTLNVFTFDDRLWISPRLGSRFQLLAEGEGDRFHVRGAGALEFERDDSAGRGSGEITAVNFELFGNAGRADRHGR